MQADGEFGARRRARDQFGQHFGQMAAICKIGFAKPDASVVGKAAKCSAAQALAALVHRRALGTFLAWPSFLVLLPMSQRAQHPPHPPNPTPPIPHPIPHPIPPPIPPQPEQQESDEDENGEDGNGDDKIRTGPSVPAFLLMGWHPEWCARLSRGGFHVHEGHQG